MDKKGFEIIKKELREVQDKMCKLKGKEYTLNKEYLELLKDKCKENIGRCFAKIKDGEIISYCKIVDIDKTDINMMGSIHFNEFQYPSIWFKYSYDNSVLPFYEDDLFSGAWGKGNDPLASGVSYIEISKEEFLEKFNEVNSEWIKKI